MAAIFDLSFFQTWDIIRSGLIGLPDLENMGIIAVGISLILSTEAEIYFIQYLLPVTGNHLRSSLIVSLDLEYMGIAVEFCFHHV